MVDAVLAVGTQCGALGAATDGTAYVAQRNGRMAARDREFGYRGQRGLHGVDPLFQTCRLHGVDRLDLVACRISRGKKRRDIHQLRYDTPQLSYRLREVLLGEAVGKQGGECRKLVDGAVSLDAQVAFVDPLATDERRGAVVSCLV